MNYSTLLTSLGGALLVFGLVERGWALLACWLGCNFIVVGIAHGRGAHRVFGKRRDGTLPWWSWGCYFPLLAYIWIVWRVLRLSPEPACSKVTEHLVMGRRLLPAELVEDFENFVDLTAEFQEAAVFRRRPGYVSFPILDGAAPAPEAMRTVIDNLKPGRTFVHCAQGHGRAGLFALAILLSTKAAINVEEGLRTLRAVRPDVRLSREQRNCIQRYGEHVK